MVRAVKSTSEPPIDEATELAWRGIELCRHGRWREGLYDLSEAAEVGRDEVLPGLFFAYFGYAIARLRGELDRAIDLCRHAVSLEFSNPEGYDCLARSLLLAGDRRAAMDAIEGGLQVDPSHSGLLQLKREMGIRRPPVLPTFPRRHPLNRLLGRVRHRVLGESRPG